MKRAIIIALVLLLGIGLLAYPAVSNYLTEQNGSTAIQQFKEQIVEKDTAELDEQRALAEQYNASLNGRNIKDPFVQNSGIVLPGNYAEILNFANHMMGYIEIPKIDVYLPIYHGVTDDVLAKGIGHMSETAFPIGGKGNHSVLTGHSALPTAKLFTDLPELKGGDTFYVHILGETLAYKVDQLKVVKPDETDDLLPTANGDYVTLVTCTPYAVNTHRLLVRGTRTEYTEQQHKEELQTNTMLFNKLDKQAVFYGAGAALLILLLAVAVIVIYRKRKNRAQKR